MQRRASFGGNGVFTFRWWRRRAVISSFAAVGAVTVLAACGGETPSAPSQPTVQAVGTQAASTGATAVSAGASAAGTAQAAASPAVGTAQALVPTAQAGAGAAAGTAGTLAGTAVAAIPGFGSPSPSPSPAAMMSSP